MVYVDNDPMVTCHNRALLAGDQDGVAVLHGDIRCPGQILKQDDLWKTIDFGRPVGVLFVAVLHFIPGEDDPQASVTAFCSLMAPGSFLAVTHISSDGTGPAVMAAIHEAYRTASAPAVFRSRGEIEGFFAGLDLVQPGIVEVSAWRASANRAPVTPAALRVLGGVGRKR